jgi:hypothetical protein
MKLAAPVRHGRAPAAATVVDVGEVARAVTAAELTRDRLKTALPRLQERWHEVALAESIASWKVDYEQVGAELTRSRPNGTSATRSSSMSS